MDAPRLEEKSFGEGVLLLGEIRGSVQLEPLSGLDPDSGFPRACIARLVCAWKGLDFLLPGDLRISLSLFLQSRSG